MDIITDNHSSDNHSHGNNTDEGQEMKDTAQHHSVSSNASMNVDNHSRCADNHSHNGASDEGQEMNNHSHNGASEEGEEMKEKNSDENQFLSKVSALKKRVTFVDDVEASRLVESVYDPPGTDERTPFLQDKRWKHTPGDENRDQSHKKRRKSNICRVLLCQDADSRALSVAFLLSTSLFLGQIVVGTLGHSLVLLADSGHTGADAATYLVNLYAEYTRFSQSHGAADIKRIGLWAAAISTCVMVAMASFMAFEAVGRLLDLRSAEIPPDPASILCMGIFGLFVDGTTLYFFMRSENHHGHSHGGLPCEHSHSKNTKVASKNANMLSALIHVIGDLTRSVTVVIGGTISLLGLADVRDVDSVCSVIVFFVIAIGAALVCEKISHVLRHSDV